MFIFIRSDYFKNFATHSTLERDGFEVASERVSFCFFKGKERHMSYCLQLVCGCANKNPGSFSS